MDSLWGFPPPLVYEQGVQPHHPGCMPLIAHSSPPSWVVGRWRCRCLSCSCRVWHHQWTCMPPWMCIHHMLCVARRGGIAKHWHIVYHATCHMTHVRLLHGKQVSDVGDTGLKHVLRMQLHARGKLETGTKHPSGHQDWHAAVLDHDTKSNATAASMMCGCIVDVCTLK